MASPPGLKGLGDIISLGSPSGPPEEVGEGQSNPGEEVKEEGPPEMLVGAAHDVMSAMRARDAEGFAAALKDFVSMC